MNQWIQQQIAAGIAAAAADIAAIQRLQQFGGVATLPVKEGKQ